MAQRVFLHIGTMKSGTSYLQRLLWRHRDELARRGLAVPGEKEYDQRSAAMIVRTGADQLADRLSSRQLRAWEQILAETAATPRDAIISNEVFCNAPAEHAREALQRLGSTAEEVHVVLTARDLGRILPSAWQQRIKQGHDHTFDEFWRAVSNEGPDGSFHRHYDVPGILDRWTPGLPPERVHVIVHPRPGSDAPRDWLWLRLCEVTGVDPSGLDTDVANSNESLGLAEVEVMRAVNFSLRSGRTARRNSDARHVKQTLLKEVLLPAGGKRFVAPPEALAWASEQGRSMVEQIEARGWHIVGDLADLVTEPDQRGRTPDDVTGEEVAGVALASLTYELARGVRQERQLRKLREEVRRLRAELEGKRARRLGKRALAAGRRRLRR